MYDWGEKMERRPYGNTGIDLSILGFGGILVMDCGRKEASRIVAKSVDCGINYFDVAPSYGNAEERLGPALEPYRKEVFLACKTGERSWKRAEDELMQSLKNMKTDEVFYNDSIKNFIGLYKNISKSTQEFYQKLI